MANGYKQVKTLSPEDAAYIAGLIDGEGTISLSRKHRNENRQLVVSISNTGTQLLYFVLHTVGAGRITNKRTYRSNHTPNLYDQQPPSILAGTNLPVPAIVQIAKGKACLGQLRSADATQREILTFATH